MKRTEYLICNVKGFEESRVLYADMADSVADRFNADPAMAKGAPYVVCPVTEDAAYGVAE
jgi:hypothetical protein